jgi:transposase
MHPCVHSYKALANVERAFRSLKTVDLKMRPIQHRTADRVRALTPCVISNGESFFTRRLREEHRP